MQLLFGCLLCEIIYSKPVMSRPKDEQHSQQNVNNFPSGLCSSSRLLQRSHVFLHLVRQALFCFRLKHSTSIMLS